MFLNLEVPRLLAKISFLVSKRRFFFSASILQVLFWILEEVIYFKSQYQDKIIQV